MTQRKTKATNPRLKSGILRRKPRQMKSAAKRTVSNYDSHMGRQSYFLESQNEIANHQNHKRNQLDSYQSPEQKCRVGKMLRNKKSAGRVNTSKMHFTQPMKYKSARKGPRPMTCLGLAQKMKSRLAQKKFSKSKKPRKKKIKDSKVSNKIEGESGTKGKGPGLPKTVNIKETLEYQREMKQDLEAQQSPAFKSSFSKKKKRRKQRPIQSAFPGIANKKVKFNFRKGAQSHLKQSDREENMTYFYSNQDPQNESSVQPPLPASDWKLLISDVK